jgi:hypothetical protein
MHRSVRRAAATLIITAAAAAGACAAPGLESVAPARGVPGFDTRDYPGDAAMRAWRDASPYRWVGYYLPAPCYTGTTWTGRRAALRDVGWGFAVLFVGEQDWSAMGAARAAADTAAATPAAAAAAVHDSATATGADRCVAANLSAEQGARHAADAASAAAADAFPSGTVIFLDVERVERVSSELADYVRGWAAALLEDGRYVPGVYAHDNNAAELFTLLTEEFLVRQRVERPRLWVAKQDGFDTRRSPAESGYPLAAAWQGRFNIRERWGGVELLIDVNVADSPDPSRGR